MKAGPGLQHQHAVLGGTGPSGFEEPVAPEGKLKIQPQGSQWRVQEDLNGLLSTGDFCQVRSSLVG